MNQIIWINDKNTSNSNRYNDLYNSYKAKKRYFFIFSLFITLFLSSFAYFMYSHFSKDDIYSNRLINNYSISQLYNNVSPDLINTSSNFSVLGIIEIPKLNITYPIIFPYTEDNLKIAPCKISGPDLNEIGNLCIAGHNYNNSLFFSNINSLKVNDEILIFNLDGSSYKYNVSSIFEVSSNDLSVLNNSNSAEITLITCNNFNSNRIIVKAILYKNY